MVLFGAKNLQLHFGIILNENEQKQIENIVKKLINIVSCVSGEHHECRSLF